MATDCLLTVHSNVDAFYERWYMLAQLTEDWLTLATELLPYYLVIESLPSWPSGNMYTLDCGIVCARKCTRPGVVRSNGQ